MLHRLLVVAATSTLLASCGGDDRGGTPSGDFCQAYADMCPAEPDLESCNVECADGTDPAAGDCWFKACAVMTGFCDNEERGDPSIVECAISNGWWEGPLPCEELPDECEYCPDDTSRAECLSIAEADDQGDCAAATYTAGC